MFQTPQRRAGGGIMAGVAPINMQDGGDPNDTWGNAAGSLFRAIGDVGRDAYDDYVPDMPTPSEALRMYDEGIDINLGDMYGKGNFVDFSETQLGSMKPVDYFPTKTEEGSGMNLRDVTDFLVVDPEDPVDVAIAASAVGMLAFPPGLIGVGLAKLGYSGVKAARVLKRIVGLQKKLGDEELKNIQGSGLSGKLEERARELGVSWKDNFKRDPNVAGFVQNRIAPTTARQYETTRALGQLGEGALDKVNFISPAQADELPMMVEEPAGIAALENERVALEPMIEEAEAEAEGGIANVAKTIAEARSDKFKSPTFRRGDEDLAAVTKEDLIDAGYEGPGALTDYLNDMKFDDELGRYIEKIEAEGKANGGIMRLSKGKFIDSTFGKVVEAYKKRQALAKKAPWREQDLPGPRSGGGKTEPGKAKGPEGETVEGGGANKDGMIKKGLKSTGKLALYGAGAYGGYKLLADNAEEELNTAVAAGASDTEIAALKVKLADAQKKLAEALEGNTTVTTPPPSEDEGNPLKQLFSKVRRGLTFDDPQKALYIAGQMMKPTKGIVPVNAFTAGTEAAMAFDKNQSEMARNQAAIDQVGTDLEREFFTLKSSAEAELGRELKATEANELLLYVRADMQSKKALMTLFSTAAPDLINKDTVNQLSLSEAAKYIRELKA
tara:strand:+ start:19 stop:2022 length:2004 start_codon:yes stop_codon:yes gene_type:complete